VSRRLRRPGCAFDLPVGFVVQAAPPLGELTGTGRPPVCVTLAHERDFVDKGPPHLVFGTPRPDSIQTSLSLHLVEHAADPLAHLRLVADCIAPHCEGFRLDALEPCTVHGQVGAFARITVDRPLPYAQLFTSWRVDTAIAVARLQVPVADAEWARDVLRAFCASVELDR
jgi:hypothetical protein